jgi:hypothetical protein
MRAPSLRILNSALELVADIERYGELYYTRSLVEPGDFGFSLPLEADTEGAIAEGAFVLVGIDGTRIGVIEETEHRTLEKGTEWIIARGHEATSILSRRIILPKSGTASFELEGPAESVMKALVTYQCGPGAAPERQFPVLAITPDMGRGCSYSLSSSYASLLTELSTIAKASGLGFALSLDTSAQRLSFDVIEGVDRSAGEHENARALFAEAYDSLARAQLTTGFGQCASVLYVLGAKLPDRRPLALAFESPEPEGFGRFERAIDAPSLSDDERLKRYGQAHLGAYSTTFFLEAELPAHSPLEVDKDFRLGDLCSIHAYGRWYTVPIHSIEEHWTKDGHTVRLGFGRPAPGAFSAAMGRANELFAAIRAG